MFAFLRKNQILLASYFCLLLSLYIVSAAARGRLKSDPIGPVLMWVLRPMEVGIEVASGWAEEIQQTYAALTSYKAENEKLRQRIQALEIERNKWLEAEATNRRLQRLLDFRSHLPVGSVAVGSLDVDSV